MEEAPDSMECRDLAPNYIHEGLKSNNIMVNFSQIGTVLMYGPCIIEKKRAKVSPKPSAWKVDSSHRPA
jgi:hypothetical protein